MTLRMVHEAHEPQRDPRAGTDALPEGPELTRRVGFKGRVRRLKEWLLRWR